MNFSSNFFHPYKLLVFVIPCSKRFHGSVNSVFLVFISMPTQHQHLGVNLEITTVSRQRAIIDTFWAWTGGLITIFMAYCHFLLFHLSFVVLFWAEFFSLLLFVFDISYLLCIAQTWRQQPRVLNRKKLFCRSFQIPKSCSVCEGGRKPRVWQSNPGSKQLQNTCAVKRLREKEEIFFLFYVLISRSWEAQQE